MPDPRIPEFPREMVSCSGLLLTTAVQSAAREMMKRIIAWFWNTKFKNSSYKLIPRAIFATENVTATHTAIALAPSRVKGTNKVLIHTTGAHLSHADCLLRDVEKDRRMLQKELTVCAQHNQTLNEELQRATEDARRAREDQSVLAQKLYNEIALRKAAESKFAQAEVVLVHVKTRQAEMEETYLTANETQECQPAIGKEDSSLILTEPQLKGRIHENLPSLNGTEEQPWISTNDWTFPEGYSTKDQMCLSWKKPRRSEE